MKIETSELIGPPLDWAAAKAEGYEPHVPAWAETPTIYLLGAIGMRPERWSPSTNWAQGGPIIEREDIELHSIEATSIQAIDKHRAQMARGFHAFAQYGPTKLIAAMRCFVASKLGDEVDVPEELLR